MSDRIQHLTDATFASTIANSSTPVLVDFWAPWCGPCHAIAPVLDELAATYDGRVAIAKVNVDEHVNTASEYSIRAIPTMVLFDKGEVVERIEGLLPKRELITKFDAWASRTSAAVA